MTSGPSPEEVEKAYLETQTLDAPEVPASLDDLQELSDSWKDGDLPSLQRHVADVQLANLAAGKVDPVFASLITALKGVEMDAFSILDAACATGYYGEVIRTLDPRPIDYRGCDYSPAMIDSARAHYPDGRFDVQDLTALGYGDRSFDVVLLSGVLEHIPAYRSAISEAARVAGEYVIVHRCPTTPGRAHERTIGTQYNIRTPRTFFALEVLRSEFADEGFDLVQSVEVYPRPVRRRPWWRSWRGAPPPRRGTQTLVFRRRR